MHSTIYSHKTSPLVCSNQEQECMSLYHTRTIHVDTLKLRTYTGQIKVCTYVQYLWIFSFRMNQYTPWQNQNASSLQIDCRRKRVVRHIFIKMQISRDYSHGPRSLHLRNSATVHARSHEKQDTDHPLHNARTHMHARKPLPTQT
jgi:hypothetical protein